MAGIGFIGILTICLIVLKLTGLITISWVWVLCPIWITAILVALFLVAMFVLAYIFGG